MHDKARPLSKHAGQCFLAALLCAAMAAGCGKEPEAQTDAASAPSIQVIDTPGLVQALERGRGRVVVLNLWATWCPPCVEEMPHFAAFHRRYAPKGVKLLSVSVDHPDTLEDRVRPFAREHNLPFGVLVVDERSPEALGRALNVEWGGSVPVTFVFDKKGRLRQTWPHEVKLADLAAVVDPMVQ